MENVLYILQVHVWLVEFETTGLLPAKKKELPEMTIIIPLRFTSVTMCESDGTC